MSQGPALDDAEFDAARIADADDVTRLARALYGDAFAPTPGVLHVTAVDGNTGRTLRIDEHTPKSRADTFALNLARARADAIIVTGGVLRDEPALSYAPGAPGPHAPGFAAYRRALGLTAPPWLVVLTRGANLPLDHAAFHDRRTRPLIYGPAAGVTPLRQHTDAEVVEHEGGALLAGLVGVLGARGAATISFEAGPSTTRDLYARPTPLVDELCLSTYHGAPLADGQLTGDAVRIPPELVATREAVVVHTAGGAWRFGRYRRR